jgi:hypothetical protein
MTPDEHEVIELSIRHNLSEEELASVLEVSWSRAHALATQAREHLEKALDALLITHTGRDADAVEETFVIAAARLGGLRDPRKLRPWLYAVARNECHDLEECDACADRSHGALGAAVRYGMAPLAELPPGLREEILDLCADTSADALSYRREVTQRAGTFLPNGFPQAVRPPRRRMLALSGVAAAVGVLVAIMATGIVTVLALTGVACPAAGRRGGGRLVRLREHERGCRNGRRNVAGRADGHQRAAVQQRAASGGARVRLADQGEAVAVTHGRLPGTGHPDAEVHVPPAHTHAHAHVNSHVDRHRHAAAAADLHGHLHAALATRICHSGIRLCLPTELPPRPNYG